jgi:hypothetical protein
MYQPWRNEAFLADEYVQAMSPIQRWIYRTLLQAAFTCSERPYLPDDDSRLWALAGCETSSQWVANKEVIRARFVPVTIDGKPLLGHKKVLEDWSRIQDALATRRESARKAGLVSAAKRQRHADGTFVSDQQDAGEHPTESNEPLDGTQRNPTNRTERNVTEQNVTKQNLPTNQPPVGGTDGRQVASPSAPKARDNGSGNVKEPMLKFQDMQNTWSEYRDDPENNAEALSIGLSKAGFTKLEDKLEPFHLLTRIDDVKAAFKVWLADRYEPSLETDDKIIRPLAVFANDVVQYITALESKGDNL